MSRSESKLLLTLGGSIVGFLAFVMITIFIVNVDRFNTLFTLPGYFVILFLITYLIRWRSHSVSMLIMILTWRTAILGGFIGLVLSTILLRNGMATLYVMLIGSGLGFFLGLMIYVNIYLRRINE
ncbi:MAG: hypothetical protein QM703_13130 [Gemmatales bacterium]